MPFIFPTKKFICPFCFERFHPGFVHVRESSVDSTETLDMEIYKHFDQLGTNAPKMPAATPPSGGFRHYFYNDPIFKSPENSSMAALLGNFIIASYRGILWLLRCIYYPSIYKTANSVRRPICPHCHLPLPPLMMRKGHKSNIIVAITGFQKAGTTR